MALIGGPTLAVWLLTGSPLPAPVLFAITVVVVVTCPGDRQSGVVLTL